MYLYDSQVLHMYNSQEEHLNSLYVQQSMVHLNNLHIQ